MKQSRIINDTSDDVIFDPVVPVHTTLPEAHLGVEELEQKQKQIPPSNIYGHSLKGIKSYKKIRRGYKLSNQKQVFVSDLKLILKEFPVEKHQYDDELLIEILNIAEAYFVYGDKTDREEIKSSSVKELMLDYFKGDEELLCKTVTHIWHKVKKSTLPRRLWTRLKNFFFIKAQR